MISEIFRKLNYKEGYKIVILNSPKSFDEEIDKLKSNAVVNKSISKNVNIDFIMLFVKMKAEIDSLVPKVMDRLSEDALLWIAYPKKSSKEYDSDISRDSGWAVLGEYNYEPVRMISVDENWSALRFRNVEFIKNMSRRKNMAISEKGRKKSKGK
jgi:hypothetical protein